MHCAPDGRTFFGLIGVKVLDCQRAGAEQTDRPYSSGEQVGLLQSSVDFIYYYTSSMFRLHVAVCTLFESSAVMLWPPFS